MKPGRHASAFAGWNHGSDDKVGTDEGGDASASRMMAVAPVSGCRAQRHARGNTPSRQASVAEAQANANCQREPEARIDPRDVGRARCFTTNAQSRFAPRDSPRLGSGPIV
jgi:hypothetical protein